jgi:hypothetical protein
MLPPTELNLSTVNVLPSASIVEEVLENVNQLTAAKVLHGEIEEASGGAKREGAAIERRLDASSTSVTDTAEMLFQCMLLVDCGGSTFITSTADSDNSIATMEYAFPTLTTVVPLALNSMVSINAMQARQSYSVVEPLAIYTRAIALHETLQEHSENAQRIASELMAAIVARGEGPQHDSLQFLGTGEVDTEPMVEVEVDIDEIVFGSTIDVVANVWEHQVAVTEVEYRALSYDNKVTYIDHGFGLTHLVSLVVPVVMEQLRHFAVPTAGLQGAEMRNRIIMKTENVLKEHVVGYEIVIIDDVENVLFLSADFCDRMDVEVSV